MVVSCSYSDLFSAFFFPFLVIQKADEEQEEMEENDDDDDESRQGRLSEENVI